MRCWFYHIFLFFCLYRLQAERTIVFLAGFGICQPGWTSLFYGPFFLCQVHNQVEAAVLS